MDRDRSATSSGSPYRGNRPERSAPLERQIRYQTTQSRRSRWPAQRSADKRWLARIGMASIDGICLWHGDRARGVWLGSDRVSVGRIDPERVDDDHRRERSPASPPSAKETPTPSARSRSHPARNGSPSRGPAATVGTRSSSSDPTGRGDISSFPTWPARSSTLTGHRMASASRSSSDAGRPH